MSTNNSKWIVRGNCYSVSGRSFSTTGNLPVGTYLLKESQEGFYLERDRDCFEIPFKVYDIETKFMDHVIKTFEHTDRNLGILLHGQKGTGKSVTAKLLANRMNLPVIIINENYHGLSDFIYSIQDECIIFLDEFEKTFEESEGIELLSIMDGAYTSENRKVFILTTNKLEINTNYINRPSRIRYKKEFSDISLDTIKAYCDDHLQYPEYYDDLVKFLNKLELITIDVLGTLVQEINIHNMPISSVEDLNVETASYNIGYSVFYSDFALCSTDLLAIQESLHIDDAISAFKLFNTKRQGAYSDIDFEELLDDDNNSGVPTYKQGELSFYRPSKRCIFDTCDEDIRDYVIGDWFRVSGKSGYVVREYNPDDKIVVLYDNDEGVLTYIKVEYIYPTNAFHTDNIFK